MKLKLLTLFILFAFGANAQDSIKTKPFNGNTFDWNKVYVGGNLGLQFGTYTVIDISPLVGYRITERFSAGVGATYQYLRYKSSTYLFETNVYGGRVFGRYFFMENLFAHTEYEILNLQAYDLYPPQRVNVGSLFAGGGFIQRWNANSGIMLMILYNFTESYYTPYQNPIIRAGVMIGL